MHKTNDVFGVRSKLIESYIERESVDRSFKEALKDGNEVIVYGSSKQGKTSLILRHLAEADFVKVECSPQTQPVDIYKSILRQINVKFVESETTDDRYEHGAKIGGGFRVKIPFLSDTDVSAETQDKRGTAKSFKETYVEFNLELAQDVSELLSKHAHGKYLILENFHYLPLDVQERLAYDLRVFKIKESFLLFSAYGERPID